MPSSKDLAEYVCDQVREAGVVSMRKMFGEYAIYCDGKVVALICDDQLFVKKTVAATTMLGDKAEEGYPFPGAKPYFIVSDIDNPRFMSQLMRAIADELPVPKQKKAKGKRT